MEGGIEIESLSDQQELHPEYSSSSSPYHHGKANEVQSELKVVKEKLRLIASISSLISGFSIVSLVELQIEPVETPAALITVYAVATCVLITLHMFAVLLAVCTLPSLELLSQFYMEELHSKTRRSPPPSLYRHHSGSSSNVSRQLSETTATTPDGRERETEMGLGLGIKDPTGFDLESQNQELDDIIETQRNHFSLYRRVAEVAWTSSMGLGIVAFGVDLVVVIWIKLLHISVVAAICATVVSTPLVVAFWLAAYYLRHHEGAVLKASLMKKQHLLENKLSSLTRAANLGYDRNLQN